MAVKSFLNDFLHSGNVPYISEKAVHLDDIFERQTDHGKALLHIVKSAVDLLFDSPSDIADALAQETIISGLYEPCVCPFIVNIISLDLSHNILPKYQKLYCMKLPFFLNPKSVYKSTPISEAVICTHPHPYFLASSTTLESSSFAMPILR